VSSISSGVLCKPLVFQEVYREICSAEIQPNGRSPTDSMTVAL
jgi:hypothetical protein